MNVRTQDRDELFNRLYKTYYRRVIRFYVQTFRLSEPDAEELAQEAFVKFYDNMHEYRGDAEWGWFESTARNLALNKIRSQGTIKRGAIRPVEIDNPLVKKYEPAAPPVDFAERQDQAIKRKRLHDAVRELPAGQRQCMQLWLEDYKYEEIARLLRITVDAVKARLRDARRTLRERLGAEGELPEDER